MFFCGTTTMCNVEGKSRSDKCTKLSPSLLFLCRTKCDTIIQLNAAWLPEVTHWQSSRCMDEHGRHSFHCQTPFAFYFQNIPTSTDLVTFWTNLATVFRKKSPCEPEAHLSLRLLCSVSGREVQQQMKVHCVKDKKLLSNVSYTTELYV